MFTEEYKRVYLLLFLLFAIWSGVKAMNQTETGTAASPTLRMPGQSTQSSKMPNTNGQISSTVMLTNSTSRSKSITFQQPTTKGISEEKLEPYIIIVIIASAAVVLIAIVILLLLCIFRRRRIRRLEKERNRSYNNRNYESTVNFRSDMDTDGSTLQSDQATTSPQKTNNNPRRDAGYELVDLPNDKKQPKRQYENVTPQSITNNTVSPSQQYENVTPMVSSANDKAKAPADRYEEVFLDSSKEKNDDKKTRNNKYYENVELNN